MVRILFHRVKCIGCNACVEASPDRWRVSTKDGRSHLVGGVEKRGIYQVTVAEDEYGDNKQAAENCPVKVIRLEILS